MKYQLPKNAKARPGADPWRECKRVANWLYYGDAEIDDGPGEPTMFRGVVVVGVVLALDKDGETCARTGGVWTFDPKEPRYALALAEQLRATADRLEREAAS